jgi:uncharacterized membrane protein
MTDENGNITKWLLYAISIIAIIIYAWLFTTNFAVVCSSVILTLLFVIWHKEILG